MARQASRRRPVAASPQKQSTDPKDWVTPAEYAQQYPRLATVPAIKWAILNRAKNGLGAADAVRIVGARWLVHHERFSAWRLGEQPVEVLQPEN